MLSHSDIENNRYQQLRKAGCVTILFFVFAAVALLRNVKLNPAKSLGETSATKLGSDSIASRHTHVELGDDNWIGNARTQTNREAEKPNRLTLPNPEALTKSDVDFDPERVSVCVKKLDDLIAASTSASQNKQLSPIGVAHENTQQLLADSYTSEEMKKFVHFDRMGKRTVLATKSHVYAVYDVNTVVSMRMDDDDCHVDGVYKPSENGGIDPKIANNLRDAVRADNEGLLNCGWWCIGTQPISTGKYKGGTDFYMCKADIGGHGWRGGYNLRSNSDCVVGYEGKERDVLMSYRQCICGTVSSGTLPYVSDGRYSNCAAACSTIGRSPYRTGWWKNSGRQFWYCSANWDLEGYRGGYQLSSSDGTGPCVVGGGGKEVEVWSYRCYCQ